MPPTYTNVACGLGAAASWGVGDFSGAVATKKANPFLVIAVAHLANVVLLIAIALLLRQHLPPTSEMLWAILSGAVNGLALAALYQSLSAGSMSIAAPLSAVLAAAVPVFYTAIAQGLPKPLQFAGLIVAFVGIVLLSYPIGGMGHPKGLLLAALSGLGFGFFFIVMPKATAHSYLWPFAAARFASGMVALSLVLATRTKASFAGRGLWIALASGLFDLSGNFFFVAAAHSGRLDIAAVLASLYPGTTVLLARALLKERVSRIQELGILAALVAVAMIAHG
jgi:drug/metabolite transporter (DMT)-like permease